MGYEFEALVDRQICMYGVNGGIDWRKQWFFGGELSEALVMIVMDSSSAGVLKC